MIININSIKNIINNFSLNFEVSIFANIACMLDLVNNKSKISAINAPFNKNLLKNLRPRWDISLIFLIIIN